jgi:integrase
VPFCSSAVGARWGGLGPVLGKKSESAACDYQRSCRCRSIATSRSGLQLLGQALRLALQRGRIVAVPLIRQLPEKNVRQGFFERPEFEGVVGALPDYLQDLTRFAHAVGWRKGEILSLRWPDVDRPGRVIRLRPEESKNGRGRMVTIDGDLAALIERRWHARLLSDADGMPRVTDLVFHNAGDPFVDFRKAWATACIKAGVFHVEKDAQGKEHAVPDRLFHDLRRTAIRNMVRAGVPERVAMEISGHRTRAIFDRYNIVSENDLRTAMHKTAQYVDTLPRTRTPGE